MARKRKASGSSGFSILVVDDREEALSSTRALLERDGHRVVTAASGEEALELFHAGQIQLLIVDYIMPQMSGEEFIAAIREQDSDVQILLQTGYAGEKPPREMLHTLDIQCYHDKPDGPDSLLLWVDVALKASQRLQTVRETEQLKAQILWKEEALADLCHEMRTPLQILSGYSEMLQDHLDPASAPAPCREVENIQHQTQALEFLISDFLYFAQLEAGARVVIPEKLGLDSLQAGFEDIAEFLFQDLSILHWQLTPELPLVWADPHSLLVILRNILVDTARGTHVTQIELSATQPSPKTPVAVRVSLTISDSNTAQAFHSVFPTLFESTKMSARFIQRLLALMNGSLTTEQPSATQICHTFSLPLAAQQQLPESQHLPLAA